MIWQNALDERLRAVYAADTSSDPAGWTADNPTYGHCAVVALIVQDIVGGELLRTTVGGVSHYFNETPDGEIIDLTREQFPRWEPTEITRRDRAYVLSFAPTAERYRLLTERKWHAA